jgi:CRP-like cAMP-binding protein
MYIPDQNQLLGALPASEYARLEPHLKLTSLRLGEVLHESGGRLQYAYFPTSAIVSLQYITESGASSETASVGHEGMVGTSLFMGGNTTTSIACVQVQGFAYRLERSVLQEEFEHTSVTRHLLLRYTQALLTHTSQTAVCNRHHTVEQQLCRWLLATLDRIPSGELNMTQELIANMIGVRREGITEAAGKLQCKGYIRYRRGHISVLERTGLEVRACECYGVIKNEFRRLLPDVQLHPNESRA